MNTIWTYLPGTAVCSFLLLLFLCSPSSVLYSQTRKELENRRNKIQEEIKQANKLLEKTTQSRKAELQRFNLIQEQVRKREELIKNIRSEIRSVDGQVSNVRKQSNKLEKEIKDLGEEYGNILRKTYKMKLGSDPFLLLVSSQNLNQAFQRWLYVNQIKKMRVAQAALIREKQNELAEKLRQLENYREEKKSLLDEIELQKGSMANELKEKETLLNSLKKDEQSLRNNIAEKQKVQAQVQQEIQRIIAEEIERQRREAEEKARLEAERIKREKEAAAAKESSENKAATPETKPAAPATKEPVKKPSIPLTPEATALSEDFGKNKGALPWPVQKGTITRRFGTQPHPVISSITIQSNGIDIRTEAGSQVRSVFKGKVVGKRFIPGQQYMVLVQHGKYYTVYANLADVRVKEGQQVHAGEVLGIAATTDEEVTEIHFEIWQEQQLQDPATWLKR